MSHRRDGIDRVDPALTGEAEDPLLKLYVDHEEVSRVLHLWKQSTLPKAADRIQEFERELRTIDEQILEFKRCKVQW